MYSRNVRRRRRFTVQADRKDAREKTIEFHNGVSRDPVQRDRSPIWPPVTLPTAVTRYSNSSRTKRLPGASRNHVVYAAPDRVLDRRSLISGERPNRKTARRGLRKHVLSNRSGAIRTKYDTPPYMCTRRGYARQQEKQNCNSIILFRSLTRRPHPLNHHLATSFRKSIRI